jgi:hypothetical protein
MASNHGGHLLIIAIIEYSSSRKSISMQTEETSIHNQPLVVLAGWLGSKPRHLKHYAKFYETLGFQVLIEIASPFQIVLAATQKHGILKNGAIANTIQHLARSVIEAAHDLNPSYIIFHVFSNGGGFLWEAVRFELFHWIQTFTASVRKRISGIIFDSAPANYSHNDNLILNVLDYCEDQDEKSKINKYLQSMTDDQRMKSKERSHDFWYRMRNCSFPIPHLYVYSKDDSLTPYRYLEELVQHRERLFGKDMTRSLVLDSSPHCQHFRTHQDEYTSAIIGFVKYIENIKDVYNQETVALRSRL